MLTYRAGTQEPLEMRKFIKKIQIKPNEHIGRSCMIYIGWEGQIAPINLLALWKSGEQKIKDGKCPYYEIGGELNFKY